jgi:hypothetical protein
MAEIKIKGEKVGTKSLGQHFADIIGAVIGLKGDPSEDDYYVTIYTDHGDVTGYGPTIDEARKNAYKELAKKL